MFKKKVKSLSELIPEYLRKEGLETPLMQKRLIDAWDDVVGYSIAAFTDKRFIKNQTLFVKITNPALRADLSMAKSRLVARLNQQVGTQVIVDIHFY